jgi:hypothetical protein
VSGLACQPPPISGQTGSNACCARAVDTGEGAGEVDVDRDRIGEVLANLLENALRHTPAGGTVILATGREDGTVLLTVTDTGEGLTADELERIFERFYRGDSSRSRGQAGSGIGPHHLPGTDRRAGRNLDRRKQRPRPRRPLHLPPAGALTGARVRFAATELTTAGRRESLWPVEAR